MSSLFDGVDLSGLNGNGVDLGRGAKLITRKEHLLVHSVRVNEIEFDNHNPYLVKNWLEMDSTSILFGPSNVGKSFLTIDLAVHLAAGLTWFGNRVCGAVKVVYVAAEGGRGVKKRFYGYKCSKRELFDKAAPNIELVHTRIDLGDPDGTDPHALLEMYGTEPKLWIIDTLARSMGDGDENMAKDMGLFIRNMDILREATGGHIMAVHHVGKDVSKGGRGSSSGKAAVDTQIEVVEDGKLIRALPEKQKDLPKDKSVLFCLDSVFLGLDQDAEPLTTAMVRPAVDTEVVETERSATINAKDHILACLYYAPGRSLSGGRVMEITGIKDASFKARRNDIIKGKPSQKIPMYASVSYDGSSSIKDSILTLNAAGVKSHLKYLEQVGEGDPRLLEIQEKLNFEAEDHNAEGEEV